MMVLESIFAFTLLPLGLATLQDGDVGFTAMYSRPDIRLPRLNVSQHDANVSQGYLFMTPSFQGSRSPDSGPYIFETSGDMVWSGVDDVVGAGLTDVQGLHVCCFHNEDYLCFWKGRQCDIHGRGLGVVMNRHYEIAKTVRSGTPFITVDLYEFRLTSESSALLTAYPPRLHEGMWILDSLFEEIDLESGRLIFVWSALDHVSLSEFCVARGSYPAVGDGLHHSRPWDFFHINSIDKGKQGDYLISSRHADCIYLVSHKDGSIFWRLQGDNSTFQLANFTFRRQHHARLTAESLKHTAISLFDNDSDGFTAQGPESKGRLITIDHESGVAREILQFRAPGLEGQVTPSMGSVETLHGGNYLVSWGDQATMVEYAWDGTPIWSAKLGLGSRNYRTHKARWVGRPLQPPALYAYDNTTESPTYMYVSWNGATEVEFWHLYASNSENGPFTIVMKARKQGFESAYIHETYEAWTCAEAIGKNGSLGNSTVVKTALHPKTNGFEIGEANPIDPAPAPVTGTNPPAKTQHYSLDTTWQLWRYVEHFMAAVGVLVCLLRGRSIITTK